MATWDKIQRAVMLKANELNAADASTLASVYSVSTIGQTELNDRAIEFPFAAINDAILDACGMIVERIGENVNSPYRSYFHDTTDSLTDGARIPEYSQAGHPVIGRIGTVRDATTNEELEMVPRQVVKGADSITLKVSPHLYAIDGSRIWHTRTSVIADVVVWESQVERYWLESSPRGICPLPDALHPTIVNGALSIIFRGDFNSDQAPVYTTKFETVLATL
jgi:hypothetical protein